MVKIKYYREAHRVEITGHAECGEAGRDPVCASISMLAYTLAAFVENISRSKQASRKVVSLKSGKGRVGCRVRPEYSAAVKLAFDAICGGFELLAREYPEAVSYEIFWA